MERGSSSLCHVLSEVIPMGAYAIPCDKPFVATKPVKTKTVLTPEQKKLREECRKYNAAVAVEKKKYKKQQG